MEADIKKTNDNASTKKTSLWAVYSLICALVAIAIVLLDILFGTITTSIIPYKYHRLIEGIPFIVAVILSNLAFLLSVIALVVIAFNRNKMKGFRFVLLAFLLSTPFLLLTISGIYVNRNRVERKKTTDGRLICELLIQYAKDNNDYLPDANQWCDLLIEYHKQLPKDSFKYEPMKYRFKYDSSKEKVCNYAFNRNLSGLILKNIPYNTVLIFESKGNWNLNGAKELFTNTLKKRQYVYIYTKDAEIGHDFPLAINIKDQRYERVIWEPAQIKWE